MDKKLWKVAVVGCGRFASGVYLPNISKEANATCVAVVDPSEQATKSACEKFGIKYSFKTVDELIESGIEIDIAIDGAAIQAHYDINKKLLSAGINVITQKPAAPNLEKMQELMAIAKQKGVLFSSVPVHPMRYDIALAKNWMKNGAIGRPYYAKINICHGGPEYFQYRDVDPSWFYQEGSGALVDMGVHGIQQAVTLFGPAKWVSCTAITASPERTCRSGKVNGLKIKTDIIPDQYFITLKYDDERMIFIDTGFSQKATKTPHIEIYGELGTISFTEAYMTNPTPSIYVDNPNFDLRGWVTPDKGVLVPDKIDSQCCCLKDMCNALETGDPLQLSAELAAHVIEIMDKLVLSYTNNGKAIELTTTF